MEKRIRRPSEPARRRRRGRHSRTELHPSESLPSDLPDLLRSVHALRTGPTHAQGCARRGAAENNRAARALSIRPGACFYVDFSMAPIAGSWHKRFRAWWLLRQGAREGPCLKKPPGDRAGTCQEIRSAAKALASRSLPSLIPRRRGFPSQNLQRKTCIVLTPRKPRPGVSRKRIVGWTAKNRVGYAVDKPISIAADALVWRDRASIRGKPAYRLGRPRGFSTGQHFLGSGRV